MCVVSHFTTVLAMAFGPQFPLWSCLPPLFPCSWLHVYIPGHLWPYLELFPQSEVVFLQLHTGSLLPSFLPSFRWHFPLARLFSMATWSYHLALLFFFPYTVYLILIYWVIYSLVIYCLCFPGRIHTAWDRAVKWKVIPITPASVPRRDRQRKASSCTEGKATRPQCSQVDWHGPRTRKASYASRRRQEMSNPPVRGE